jgi:hypothetical protein
MKKLLLMQIWLLKEINHIEKMLIDPRLTIQMQDHYEGERKATQDAIDYLDKLINSKNDKDKKI